MSQPLTTEGTILGTIQYMAPEQLEGKEADERSDIFALGSVLYEMVTGKRAFEGKTTASTIAAILAAEPKPPSAVQPLSPPALEHVIATCIAKDPDERWQSCADVSRQLEWVAKERKPGERSSAQQQIYLDFASGGATDRSSILAGYAMVEGPGAREPVRSESTIEAPILIFAVSPGCRCLRPMAAGSPSWLSPKAKAERPVCGCVRSNRPNPASFPVRKEPSIRFGRRMENF